MVGSQEGGVGIEWIVEIIERGSLRDLDILDSMGLRS